LGSWSRTALGGVSVVPVRTFPLAQTAAALDASITSHLNGKIVVLP
jgi:NADPH:quinone reductase-like Zn-dependent oxidoreductase